MAEIDRLQQELEWIETHSTPIDGEHAAIRESWANVRLLLARIGAAMRASAQREHVLEELANPNGYLR